jgi:hypothetical protein
MAFIEDGNGIEALLDGKGFENGWVIKETPSNGSYVQSTSPVTSI